MNIYNILRLFIVMWFLKLIVQYECIYVMRLYCVDIQLCICMFINNVCVCLSLLVVFDLLYILILLVLLCFVMVFFQDSVFKIMLFVFFIGEFYGFVRVDFFIEFCELDRVVFGGILGVVIFVFFVVIVVIIFVLYKRYKYNYIYFVCFCFKNGIIF